MNHNTVLRAAINRYGKDSQIDKAIEEMSELTKALMKDRYKGVWRNGKQEAAGVAGEIADVEILMNQLKFIFDCEDEVEKIKGQKIERLNKELIT